MSEPIEPGETKRIVPARSTRQELHLTVTETDVQLGRSEDEAEMYGRPGEAGDRGPLELPPGEELWAHNPVDDPNDPKTAMAYLDRDGFFWNREPRAVVGSVRTSSESEASPANDDFRWYYDRGADLTAGIVHDFRAPDAAEQIVTSVDDADGSVEVAVAFIDPDGNEISRRDSSNSSAYAGDSTTDVFAETAIAADRVAVELTGNATSADYSVYCR